MPNGVGTLLVSRSPFTTNDLVQMHQLHRELGFGFSEKVYENALMMLVLQEWLPALPQAPLSVYFRGEVVGDYYADIVIENKIIIEL